MSQAISGIAKTKPRAELAGERLERAENQALSKEYIQARNRALNLKIVKEETEAAARRGELILKSLVRRQAAFLLVSMRAKMLGVPDAWCRRIIGIKDAHKAKAILREMMISCLNELKDMPQVVTDPQWLRKLEAENGD